MPFNSIDECADWIETLTPQEIAAHPPLQRISTAVKCLLDSPSRQKQQDIRHVAKQWHVAQKEKGKNHTKKTIEKNLKTKVLDETTRLRNLQLRGLPWSPLQQAFTSSSTMVSDAQ